ncbi:uncharacterized protein VTP21DRAFT_9812 [Calcarisporiella thermophila]|uniref:uncharacterized protein n=1 Tax=Calcarisporiella thermophila TaxID=911321 RepID=UPI003743A409
MLFLLCIGVLLLLCRTTLALPPRLQRRQASGCTDLSTQIYCSPGPDSHWTLNTTQTFVWNERNPELAPATQVDIYLIFIENEVKVVTASWRDVENEGSLEVEVTESWFPPQKPPGPLARNMTYVWQVVRAGDPQSTLPVSPKFFIEQPARSVQTSIVIESVASITTLVTEPTTIEFSAPNAPVAENTHGALQPWAIGVIAAGGACVLLVIAAALLLWRNRSKKRRRFSSTSAVVPLDPYNFPHPPDMPYSAENEEKAIQQGKKGHLEKRPSEERHRLDEELILREMEALAGTRIQGVSSNRTVLHGDEASRTRISQIPMIEIERVSPIPSIRNT